MNDSVHHLTSASFMPVLLAADRAVVDFWAEWCGPCRRFSPVFEEMALEYPDILFCKCNTDENPDIAQELCIFSIPTVLFVRNGKVLHLQSGVMTPEQFRAVVSQVFGDT